ncbi:MAG: FAD-dependent oxidoreductase [Myxococcota bacterium]|nr:FAD-dependent oxidoreductase [Myxococcota bacterium]
MKASVAVVGAGIAGSSAAWFLRRGLGAGAAITVYERDPRVGGRLATLDVGGTPVEAGGTIIHETNRYMAGFVNRLGLQRVEPHQRDAGGGESVGVWDGRRLVFRTHASTLRTRLSAVARYGVRAPLRLQRAVARGVEQWNRIYAHLEEGRGFGSPQALCSELGLAGMLEIDGRQWLSDSGVRGRFVEEYASPVGRVMYGQDVSMHALATSIALAGAGLAGSLFSVGGGNRLVCEGLLRDADSKLHAGAEVVGISRSERGLALRLADGPAPEHDVVVLATPAGPAALDLGGLDVGASALRPRPFQTTWATFVMGEPRADYFGLSDPEDLPDTLLTVEDDAIPFSSLGLVGASPDGRPVYKFFTREEPKESLLDQVFPRRDAVEQVRWQAYPVLRPGGDLPPFRLAEGLYWVNAMEFAVSTMETESVAARNVANLVVQERREATAGG